MTSNQDVVPSVAELDGQRSGRTPNGIGYGLLQTVSHLPRKRRRFLRTRQLLCTFVGNLFLFRNTCPNYMNTVAVPLAMSGRGPWGTS